MLIFPPFSSGNQAFILAKISRISVLSHGFNQRKGELRNIFSGKTGIFGVPAGFECSNVVASGWKVFFVHGLGLLFHLPTAVVCLFAGKFSRAS